MGDAPQQNGLIGDGLGNWARASKDEAEFSENSARLTPESLARVPCRRVRGAGPCAA